MDPMGIIDFTHHAQKALVEIEHFNIFQPPQTRLFDLFDTHPVLGGAFGAINVYN